MYICFVINMAEALTQTIRWECLFHTVIEPHVWTRRFEQYIVVTDITVVMVLRNFKAGLQLTTLCTWLENSYIMVSRLFAKGRCGIKTFSTPSAEHTNINMMACGKVRVME